MKYYSEITKNVYDSEEECLEAEAKVKEKEDEAKKKEAEKKQREEEVEKAFEEALAAYDRAEELLAKFNEDYNIQKKSRTKIPWSLAELMYYL